VHLHERDCSIQIRHQKVIEIAPAPALDDELRAQLLTDAVKMAKAAGFQNAGTVEFLVSPEQACYWFIECNPRIQVEHTITEQVMGVDLIEAQFRIAAGASLGDLGLADQDQLGSPRGYAIQARVVVQGAGVITAYKEPSGAGVRVDGNGYSGYQPPPQFDPLLAKVICTAGDYPAALARTRQALAEYQVAGLATNILLLDRILTHEAVTSGDARTSLIGETQELNQAPQGVVVKGAALALLEQQSIGGAAGIDSALDMELPGLPLEPGQQGVEAPMAGAVVSIVVKTGDRVAPGETLLVISAMKMESVLIAPCAGKVAGMLALTEGDAVSTGQIVAAILPDDAADAQVVAYGVDTWASTLDEVATLRGLAEARLAPGSNDPGVVRQRHRGKLTCRERIGLLLDADSFREVGSVAGFASYDEEGQIDAFTPANSVGGWGSIDERMVVICADDFTSRGGHADGAIGAKSGYLDRLAIEMRIPSVRLLDGSSGGGSVAAMVPEQKKTGESKAKESSGAIKAGRPRVAGGGGSFLPGHLGSSMYAEQLATVPVVNLLLGSVVGIGAAKAVLGHFSVMVRDVSQLFVAGPPVVSHAMGYDISKEDLGGWHIHCRNGSVDNLAETEAEAATMARRFLSYLPTSVYESPPVLAPDPTDPADRREESLFTIIPRKRTTTFDIRRAIRLMADEGSFFEIGPHWGTDQVVGFARFNGYPVGVIGSDSQHANGGALTADGCDKLTRHLDLCDLFHLPLLNLIDNPGFAVGLEHERAGTIRKGGEWMVAFAQTKIPIFSVLMRRSFGVAGNNYATPRSRPSMRVVWPAADVGGIPPEGGIEAAYKRQLAEAEDPVALRAELMARIESARGPTGPLNRFQIEEMIDPRDTRRHVCDWVEMAYRVVSTSSNLVSRPLQFRP
jgi:acetyl-CoA carboxylase carboxyltransferase component/biotin carboxyl carrier protein